MMTIGMVVSDVIAILSSGLFAILLRRFVLGSFPLAIAGWIPATILVFIIVYAVRGYYPGIGMGIVEELRLLTTTTSLVFLTIGAVTYVGGVQVDFSRFSFLMTWVISLAAVPINRILFRHFLTKLSLWGEPVAIIGETKAANRLARTFAMDAKIGLKPVFIGRNLKEFLDAPISSSHPPRTAVVLYQRLDQLNLIRDTFRDTFERVILFSSEDEGLHLNGLRVRLFGNQLTFEITQTLLDPTAQFVKRVMDLSISTLGLLLLSPVFLLIALMIRIDSKGPVLFRQQRIGKNGQPFGMLKFRTMYQNADAMLSQHLAANLEAKAEWDEYQKLTDDPRITRLGKLLRRFSIDELPQLWNVLLGEMSVVGPRPFMDNQAQIYGIKVYQYRRVRPGITGLWQISGRNKKTFEQRTALDERYVLRWSVWLDIYIIVRTVWVVLIQDGAR